MNRPADQAWISILFAILIYEGLAPKDELLSEGWDRYLSRWPVASRAVPAIVALHLTNVLPGWADPLHGFGVLSEKIKGFRRV